MDLIFNLRDEVKECQPTTYFKNDNVPNPRKLFDYRPKENREGGVDKRRNGRIISTNMKIGTGQWPKPYS